MLKIMKFKICKIQNFSKSRKFVPVELNTFKGNSFSGIIKFLLIASSGYLKDCNDRVKVFSYVFYLSLTKFLKYFFMYLH